MTPRSVWALTYTTKGGALVPPAQVHGQRAQWVFQSMTTGKDGVWVCWLTVIEEH